MKHTRIHRNERIWISASEFQKLTTTLLFSRSPKGTSCWMCWLRSSLRGAAACCAAFTSRDPGRTLSDQRGCFAWLVA